MFQSLFYWMLLSDRAHDSCAPAVHICFNPCFIGCCYQTLLPNMKEESLLCFNPCFIGCCYQTRSNVSEAGSLTVFQSLFYWMLLSDHHPCFTGLVILVTGPVSILVLLDAAIRQYVV